jgi:hypothetical protein
MHPPVQLHSGGQTFSSSHSVEHSIEWHNGATAGCRHKSCRRPRRAAFSLLPGTTKTCGQQPPLPATFGVLGIKKSQQLPVAGRFQSPNRCPQSGQSGPRSRWPRDHHGADADREHLTSSVVTTHVNLSSDFRYEAPANAALLRSLGTILRPDDFYRGHRAGDRLVMGAAR